MRIKILFAVYFLAWLLIGIRLYYWQVRYSKELSAAAKYQQELKEEILSPRGAIFSSDNFPLVLSKLSYLAYLEPKKIENLETFFEKIKNYLNIDQDKLTSVIKDSNIQWYPLAKNVDAEIKEKIEEQNIFGIGFEPRWERFYPEASMAAHLLGFVGSDEGGKEKGYFGLEGIYDRELKGVAGLRLTEMDSRGRTIIIGQERRKEPVSGRNLYLSLDRAVQFLAEEKLKEGLKKYEAISGSVVIIDPFSGGVLAMASVPSFDPKNFTLQQNNYFNNPVISSLYEPGSIIKPVVMAAAIDLGLINQKTKCDSCSGPVKIGEYSIKTWNDKYYPDSSMMEVIQHSDNVGMVFVARKLGTKNIYHYFQKFGFEEKTGIDLEGEAKTNLKPEEEWYEIDLATAAFGQGMAVTPIQIARAMAAIANNGKLIKPSLVEKIMEDGKTVFTKRTESTQIIKPITARVVTEMMINAVENGEAKWAKPKGYKIAGKTGTAQIPVAGHYDAEKTIASFVGFAPVDKPRFVMLVILREPKTSPWGSETAAPLWFEIAKGIFRLWGIPPG